VRFDLILITTLVGSISVVQLARASPQMLWIAAVPNVAGMAHIVAGLDRAFGEHVSGSVNAHFTVTHAPVAVSVPMPEALEQPASAHLVHEALRLKSS
jgi:hypothetical protein